MVCVEICFFSKMEERRMCEWSMQLQPEGSISGVRF
jgi:hypothetical protein